MYVGIGLGPGGARTSQGEQVVVLEDAGRIERLHQRPHGRGRRAFARTVGVKRRKVLEQHSMCLGPARPARPPHPRVSQSGTYGPSMPRCEREEGREGPYRRSAARRASLSSCKSARRSASGACHSASHASNWPSCGTSSTVRPPLAATATTVRYTRSRSGCAAGRLLYTLLSLTPPTPAPHAVSVAQRGRKGSSSVHFEQGGLGALDGRRRRQEAIQVRRRVSHVHQQRQQQVHHALGLCVHTHTQAVASGAAGDAQGPARGTHPCQARREGWRHGQRCAW
jgi:hypothetical protein